jgi:hypothetical protein
VVTDSNSAARHQGGLFKPALASHGDFLHGKYWRENKANRCRYE